MARILHYPAAPESGANCVTRQRDCRTEVVAVERLVAGPYPFALIPVQRTAGVQAPIRQIDLVGRNGDGAQRTFDSGSRVVAHSLASFSITNRPTIRPPGNARIFSWWISHNSARDSTSLSVDRSFRGIAQRPIGSDWFGVSGCRLQPLVSAVQNV